MERVGPQEGRAWLSLFGRLQAPCIFACRRNDRWDSQRLIAIYSFNKPADPGLKLSPSVNLSKVIINKQSHDFTEAWISADNNPFSKFPSASTGICSDPKAG
jgi:hypothetical protein